MIVKFEDWTKGRTVHSLSTNWKAEALPFQNWRRFKEAFAPELISRAVRESRLPVLSCLDPFGGSGTTALACQFLGIQPTTIEVNPFLADLIAAKLSRYEVDALIKDFSIVLKASRKVSQRPDVIFENAPATFLEPGVNGRWIFDWEVASRIAALRRSIDALPTKKHRQFFRVLLGGILVEVSNVITSGKGRRYRRNWHARRCEASNVDSLFAESVESAIAEVHRYSTRQCMDFRLFRGDAREALRSVNSHDLAVFSPPYPNSFDYTDVYNLELWTLGYLSGSAGNRRLRQATLTSHVQIQRHFPEPPTSSRRLTRTLSKLRRLRGDLWNASIPEMVGGYFADMDRVLGALKRIIRRRGSVWMVVGDSQYVDVPIKVSDILTDLAEARGWSTDLVEPFRSMRSSAQQGGDFALTEDLVVISKI